MRAIVGYDGTRGKWNKVRRRCTKGHVVRGTSVAAIAGAAPAGRARCQPTGSRSSPASRPSSAAVETPSFSIRCARYALTVRRLIASSSAICLLSLPATIRVEHFALARGQRGEAFVPALPRLACAALCGVARERAADRIDQGARARPASRGSRPRPPSSPGCRSSTSAWPVRKMIGIDLPGAAAPPGGRAPTGLAGACRAARSPAGRVSRRAGSHRSRR